MSLNMLDVISSETAIRHRNILWDAHPLIPKWVDLETVGLDQFFTRPEIAKKCYKSFLKVLENDKFNFKDHTFIEPSAGSGSFFNILPENKIGFDILPMHKDIKKQDFLSWESNKTGKYLTIGNPPFGYRAWLALSFMNKTAEFSDYAGFILPMAFQSDGKGSPKHRVKGMTLVHSEILPLDSFFSPNGKSVKINALWQIWKKGENIIPKKKTCKNWVELFTVDQRKERLCGQVKMDVADFFLQRTFFKDTPSLVKSFSDVKYVCGYGFIIKKDKKKIIAILNGVDWKKYSNLAAHNCRHISMYHIEQALTDKGYIDV